MLLREAKAEELPQLNDLCLRSKAVWGYDRAFLDACREELSLRPEALAETTVIVAEADGRIEGVSQLAVDGDRAELLKLFVEPRSIGCGLGRTLFEAAAADAKRRGAAWLRLDADPGAEPFYRRMGAVPAGTAPSGSIPGRVLPRLEFRLA